MCSSYETISFKIPNLPIFREAGTELFFTVSEPVFLSRCVGELSSARAHRCATQHWDPDNKTFSLQLVFKPDAEPEDDPAAAAYHQQQQEQQNAAASFANANMVPLGF